MPQILVLPHISDEIKHLLILLSLLEVQCLMVDIHLDALIAAIHDILHEDLIDATEAALTDGVITNVL